jgi:uncharacterized protein (UPF0335 family)
VGAVCDSEGGVSEAMVSVNGGPRVPVGVAVDHVVRGVAATLREDHVERAARLGLGREVRQAAASRARQASTAEVGNISAERLRSLVERIERLEEERKALGSDIKDIFQEAKSAGFDVKVMRQLIRLRKMEPAEVEEQEALLDVYRRALGM